MHNATAHWEAESPPYSPTLTRPTIRSWRDLTDHIANGDIPDHARSSPLVERAWNTYTSGANGGYLIDWGLAQMVWDKARAIDGPLQRCRVFRTGKHSFRLPATSESSRAAGNRLGGLQAYWVGQEDDLSWTRAGTATAYGSTEMKLASIDFTMQRCLVYSTPFSNDLLSDSDLVEDMLSYGAHLDIAYVVVDAMINGKGMGEPLGVINAPSSVQVTRNTSSNVKYQDIDAMWSKLWPFCQRSAVWHCSSDTLANIDAAATAFNWPLTYYLPMGAADNPYPLMKGRPVLVVEQCAVLGTKGDLILGDWSQYGLAVRQVKDAMDGSGFEMAVGLPSGTVESTYTAHKLFDTDQCLFRWKFRADGKPMWPSTVAIADGASSFSQGPFCVLN